MRLLLFVVPLVAGSLRKQIPQSPTTPEPLPPALVIPEEYQEAQPMPESFWTQRINLHDRWFDTIETSDMARRALIDVLAMSACLIMAAAISNNLLPLEYARKMATLLMMYFVLLVGSFATTDHPVLYLWVNHLTHALWCASTAIPLLWMMRFAPDSPDLAPRSTAVWLHVASFLVYMLIKWKLLSMGGQS